MTTRIVLGTPLLIVAASVLLAAPATARPTQCEDTGPTTTVCQTPGHAQITTSPNPALQNPLAGWGFGGIGIGIGGIFIGL
ncbi:hypothetical protein ORI20_13300 [Mycobacterium sp. CVI_P3]|uniref:Uncharacterized protein n=1 Tax=Mycobacterium pinniadriaticum TaxID=2994102 RepID=A0ABT3SDD1_9MYCO|nr:hypothetical protein [Mycobacterium pinniadriaticum]MCX2931258.1 hypothetical protein [Mycobacterium pinniadriaticum]MCX2937518.1 hypothetical protein [Mycobacterium pinniadriaticum]